MKIPTAKFWLLLLIGLIVPTAAGMIALVNHFDGLYGQDAYAYYRYAVIDLRSQLYPPPPFYWPPGYPLLVLFTSFVTGVTPLAGQIVSLVAGGLVVIFTMLLTNEVWNVPRSKGIYTAVIAAGLAMAFMGQLWQSSAVLMADTVALASATLGMWALARYSRLLKVNVFNPAWLALAAGAVAYAMITRWAYGIVAVVCTVYVLFLYWQYRHSEMFRQYAFHALIAAGAALIILLPIVISAVYQKETTFGGNFGYQFTRWDITNAFRHNFENPDGFQNYKLYNGIYYGTLPARNFYFNPFLTAFVIPGLWAAGQRKKWGNLTLILGWGAAAYLLLIGGPQQNVRFGLTYMPPIAVFIGIGFDEIWQHRNEYRLFYLLPLIFGVGLIWGGYNGYLWTDDFIERKNIELETVRWAEVHIPSEAQVIAFGVTLTMQHYTDLETHEIYYLTPDDLPELLDGTQATYVLLPLYTVENQWMGRSPSENYHWLRDERSLQQLGRFHNYTLFVVDPL